MLFTNSLNFEGVACRALTLEINARKAEVANAFIISSVPGIEALIRKWFSQHVEEIDTDSDIRALTELVACYSRHILSQDVFFRQMAWDCLTKCLMPNPNGIDIFNKDTFDRLPEYCAILPILKECQELPAIPSHELEEIKRQGCYADKMGWIKDLLPGSLNEWHADKLARYALVGHVYLE